MIGNKDKEQSAHSYQPGQEIRNLTSKIKKDYATGIQIQDRPFTEFNDMSLTKRMNKDQKAFNSYVKPESDDPDEQWRFKGVRPITRNKIISMAAHLTATTLYPNAFAQNQDDEEDKMAAKVMKNLLEWNIRNSDYGLSFMFTILSGLINPAAFMKVDYSKATQNVKHLQDDGSIKTEQVEDDVLSGFQPLVIPADEILISNPYEFKVQKQRFLIRRRFIDYDQAKGMYTSHPNFEYVEPGVKAVYDNGNNMFYEQNDDELQTLAEEATYYNRREDMEVKFINGIYMGDSNPQQNRMKHRDTKDKPKYPFAKFINEPIDEKRFFYGKSGVFKIQNEQKLIDTMWRMIVDGTFLEVMPPLGTTGGGKVDTNIIYPGAVTNFEEGAKIEKLSPGANLQSGYKVIEEAERQASQGSQSDIRQGQRPRGNPTAFEIARMEQNARIQLGITGKMIAKFVEDFGDLMVDVILNHQTVGQVEELTGGQTRMKFRNFLVPEQTEEGQKVSNKIRFTEELIGEEMTEEEELEESFRIIEEEGGIDADMRVMEVNPEKFRNLHYKIHVKADSLMPKNEAFEKALKLEAYDRMIQNPLTNQKAVTRDFLVGVMAEGEPDKYMRKELEGATSLKIPQEGGSPLVEQATKQGSLQGLLNK